MTTQTPPFTRTVCGCAQCVTCCTRQPGSLAPGDMERIAAHLGLSVDAAAQYFWASPGALVMNADTQRQFRVHTITPRLVRKRCVFLDDANQCRIHAVAPMGCAYFDTHISAAEGLRRSMWLTRAQQDPAYQALRNTLPFATSYRPSGYR